MNVPKRRFYGEMMSFQMMIIILGAESRREDMKEQGWTGREVLGYRLPEWQRPEVWTDQQCQDFIESVYLGANIGSFMVNSTFEKEFDNILIDGQQSLRAIERYIADEFAICGEKEIQKNIWQPTEPKLWSQLEDNDKVHFYRITFPVLVTQYTHHNILKEAYNRHNFSGTPHKLEDKITDEVSFRPMKNK